MMVELNTDIIKVINDVNKVLEESPFEINRFEVGSTGAGGEIINIDIRRHKNDLVSEEAD